MEFIFINNFNYKYCIYKSYTNSNYCPRQICVWCGIARNLSLKWNGATNSSAAINQKKKSVLRNAFEGMEGNGLREFVWFWFGGKWDMSLLGSFNGYR
jgi:hypothetical protein